MFIEGKNFGISDEALIGSDLCGDAGFNHRIVSCIIPRGMTPEIYYSC